ncbi:MAG: glycosyltransferase [Myxococcales bacterium]|nr:glycosyltransferase [Myxococcales bacterium]MCB9650109.1 glycosyltransferase [Deltaproteobacteria bacterium]
MSDRIELSVVVPVVNTLNDALDALAALERERASVALEALVINRRGPHVGGALARTYPWVRRIDVDRHTTIPEMRQIGIESALGDAVGVIEDHVVVSPGWARRMLDKLAEGHDVVGGAIDNAATETLLDWACFLCEYSHCIPPLPEGASDWVPGNNVVYRRAVLEAQSEALAAGRWEDHLHAALKAAGVELFMEPGIVVGHKKHYTLMEYLTQRYLYARSFAGARVEGASAVKRLAYGVGALGLPPVLMARTVSRLWKKKRHTQELVRSLPLISLFMTSWGLGEVVGSLLGSGDSLEKVC